MLNNGKFKFIWVTSLFWLIASCTTRSSVDVAPSPELTATLQPTPTFSITDTPIPLPTNTLESIQLDEPQPAALPNGMVIYDDTRNFLVFDLQTESRKILLSRQELESQLPPDRSAESSNFEAVVPLRVYFSPDFTKAHISICANLDEDFRCGFRDFIYDLAQRSLIELRMPSDMYGVHWQWSPDGSQLAGAGWTYRGSTHLTPRYYSINSDGSNLRQLSVIKTKDWRMEWHPGGQAIIPMITQSRFNTILADASGTSKINIEELNQNDKMECLEYSPDYQSAAFITRNADRENIDRAFISRSDFEFPSMVFELNMDARYHCELTWSPDQKYLHIQYSPDWKDSFDLEQEQPPLPPLDFVYDIETTGALLNLPASASACGWTPDNKLIYVQKNQKNNSSIVGLFDPITSNTIALPENLQKSLRGCPVAWLSVIDLELPEQAQASNVCHPGGTFQDIEEISLTIPYYNILEVSTSLKGETLSASIKTAGASSELTNYLTPGINNFTNGWDVLVDIDNNILTGDQAGIEYRLVASIRPEEDGTKARLIGGILQFSQQTLSYSPIGELNLSLDADNSVLTLSGIVPGITPDSRIVITSRVILSITNSQPNLAGDLVCE